MHIHGLSLRIAAVVIALLCASTQSRAQDRSDDGNASWEREPAPAILNLFVAPWGRDDWSGRLPEVNRQGTDRPFKTFDHARGYVRTVDRTGVADQRDLPGRRLSDFRLGEARPCRLRFGAD